MTPFVLWVLMAASANNSHPFVVTDHVINTLDQCVTYVDYHGKAADKIVPSVKGSMTDVLVWVLTVHIHVPERPTRHSPVAAFYDQNTCEMEKARGPEASAYAEAEAAAHGSPAPMGEQLTYTCEKLDLYQP